MWVASLEQNRCFFRNFTADMSEHGFKFRLNLNLDFSVDHFVFNKGKALPSEAFIYETCSNCIMLWDLHSTVMLKTETI